MENYDVYIIAPIITESNNLHNKVEDDISALHYNINKLMCIYKAKVDMYNSIDSEIKSDGEYKEYIDASSCVIIIMQSDNIQKFMPLISYTISKNKKLYVLILNSKTQVIQTGIIANGYEDVTVDIKRSDIGSYQRCEGFILSAIKESRVLHGKNS
jgi:hypothetical protein